MTARRARLAVAVAGIVAIAVGIAVLGSQSALRQLGSNYVVENEFPVTVPAGARACQDEAAIPGGAGTLRLLAGTFGRPGPALRVTIEDGGRTIATGSRRAGWVQGHVLVPVSTVQGDRAHARVCVRNRGPAKLALGGRVSAPTIAAHVGGKAQTGQFRIEYDTPRPLSWWSFAGRFPSRVATVHDAFPGGATFWLWIVFLAGAAAGVALLVVRGGSER